MQVEEVRKEMEKYLKTVGGLWNLTEYDQEWNDIERKFIDAYYRQHKKCYLVKLTGKPLIAKYKPNQLVRNFSCDLIVSKLTKELKNALKEYMQNKNTQKIGECFDKVADIAIEQCNGYFVHWV